MHLHTCPCSTTTGIRVQRTRGGLGGHEAGVIGPHPLVAHAVAGQRLAAGTQEGPICARALVHDVHPSIVVDEQPAACREAHAHDHG